MQENFQDIRQRRFNCHQLVCCLLLMFIIQACSSNNSGYFEVSVARNSALHLLPSASFNEDIVLTQHVSINYRDCSYEFIMQVEIDKTSFRMVGLSPLGYLLFSVILSNKEIQIEKSPSIPEILNPQFVLADFQLIFGGFDLLKSRLIKMDIEEKKISKTKKIRIFKRKNQQIIKVKYENKMSSRWDGTVAYNHLERMYSIMIKTHTNKKI